MWLKVTVVGLKAAHGQKPKTTEVFSRFNVNAAACQVQDQALAPFCWPLGPENQSQKEFMAPEEFMFTLTQGDGSRLQGFCRRFLPPAPRVGSKLRYPQVLCLVCEAAWSAFFFKVLEVTEQLLRQSDLLSDFSHQQMPADSLAGAFLSNLGSVLAQQPELGSVIRVDLPRICIPLAMSPPKRIGGAASAEPLPLLLTEEFIELQVPPDAGNGIANAGVSLARLLWHVPVPAMVTLIASLLLERRVLVVGQSRDMVSAAVCAAQALIHPFRWHHIFLPLLPRSLSDYLTAPMPFLIGMPAQLLPAIKNLPMDEITLIDLDLGKCEPAPGTARDDAQLLPWREQLESALHAAFSMLKSPTEHESNPVIAGIMHGYFLKLLGNYRSHIYPEGTGPGFTPAAPPAYGSPAAPAPNSRSPGHQRSRSASPLHGGPSSNALAAFAADSKQGARNTGSSAGAGSTNGSRRQSRASSSNVGPVADEGMKAHGFWFDHAGLVAAHRRNDKARNFLLLLRQSQLFEVFVRERLEMYATVEGGPELSGDPFEQLVNNYLENRSKRLSVRLGAGVRSSLSRFGALIKKHRRGDSLGFSSSGADTHGSSASANGGFAGGLRSGLSRGMSGGGSMNFAERPEAVKMRQMVSSFAAAAEQMKRSLRDGSSGNRGLSSLEAFADKVVSVFDPSSLFDNEDDDEAEAEAAAAAAAAAEASSQRISRSSMSSSSLKDLVSGPLIPPSGASWTAGAAASSRSGSLATQSTHMGLAGPTSSSNAINIQQGGSGRGSPPLGRHSVPVVMHGSSGSTDRPASPAPLKDLAGADGSSTTRRATEGGSNAASGAVQQQQQLPHHRFLEQLQMPPQQQQQQQQVHSPRSPRDLQSQWQQQQQRSPNSGRESLIQQFMRPPLSSSGGSIRGQQQQQLPPQHINVKAALAAIAPGPLPQPPPPRTRSLVGGHILNAEFGQPSQHMQPLRQGLSNMGHLKQQQQQQQQPGLQGRAGGLFGPASTPAAAAGGAGAVSSSSGQAGAVWDPFAELLTERVASLSGGTAAAVSHHQQQQQQEEEQQYEGHLGMAPLSVAGRGISAGSEGGASAVDSTAGVKPRGYAGAGSSSDGSASSSSSDGGAASAAFSTSTTPAGATVSYGSMAFEAFGQHHQQQQEQQEQQAQPPSLQQQPTMPEAWLAALTDLGETGGQGGRSSISLTGGHSHKLPSTTTAAAADGVAVQPQDHHDAGLSQLKQAFAQQLMMQHSSAGDDLL